MNINQPSLQDSEDVLIIDTPLHHSVGSMIGEDDIPGVRGELANSTL